jgi:hypothetical protein
MKPINNYLNIGSFKETKVVKMNKGSNKTMTFSICRINHFSSNHMLQIMKINKQYLLNSSKYNPQDWLVLKFNTKEMS